MGKPNPPTQLMIYNITDYYFSRMITLNTQQHLKEDLLILFCNFTFFIPSFPLFYLFANSHAKRNITPMIYIAHHILCIMYYIVSEICIGGRFLLEDYLVVIPQQIISATANQSLIPYNLIKRAPETQNVKYCNTECQPKPNQNVKYISVLEHKILFHTDINNKNMCKIVCKMQCYV